MFESNYNYSTSNINIVHCIDLLTLIDWFDLDLESLNFGLCILNETILALRKVEGRRCS